MAKLISWPNWRKVVLVLGALICGEWSCLPGTSADEQVEFAEYQPLLPPADTWELNDYWLPGKVGRKDFYFAEAGPYYRYNEESIATLRQVGLYDRMIPGHANLPKRLESFAPEVRETLPPTIERLAEAYLDNQWPVFSIEYCTFHGNPPPSEAARKAVGDLWIGDGTPEQPYRLEPVFHYIRTGEKWRGSSQYLWKDEAAISFFEERLFPVLEKELPFFRDLEHEWTRTELRKLCDIFCEEFYRPVGKAVAWGMHLSPYHMASLPTTTAVGEKGADAFVNARARGLMRQFGGRKFFVVWRGHEPTERWAYLDRSWFALRECWGYPLPLMRYYFFRPYLIGANYYHQEGAPGSLMQDIEGDGQQELSTLGEIATDMLDFVDRHPDRGVPYAPIALLTEYTRQLPNDGMPGVTYFGYNLPFDDADQMTAGIIRHLFPEHRHVRFTGDYGNVAPYGEIFDILSPNLPGREVDPKALASYKVLFALGGLQVDADYAEVLKEYVRNGGALVINIEDTGEHLLPEFFGVSTGPDTVTGNRSKCEVDGSEFEEQEFSFRQLNLDGARAIYTCDGQPLVALHKVGKGYAILVAAHYMVQDDVVEAREGRGMRTYDSKPLLRFVPDFLARLTGGLCPIEFRRREQDREDLSWLISKKGDGWVVTVFNYSLERELVTRRGGTANLLAEYPYKALPFEIVCRTPVEDVVEWYEDRDVDWSRRDGKAVISEAIRGGEVRVYELQPHAIDLGTRTRFVNYALDKPVRASSTMEGFSPQAAVDGKRNNDDYWQSGTGTEGSEREASRQALPMPQWLEVDLGESKLIDHVFVLCHCWPMESLDTRLRVYKYIVAASEDGENWQTVIDESNNEDPARRSGLQRWFDPVRARYVRLTVQRNSGFSGAQVVELKVMGPERETYHADRQSIIPAWQVQYPDEIREAPLEKVVYLMDLEPKEVRPGWMPAGAKWGKLNGSVTLMTDFSGEGGLYARSLYGQSSSEVVYDIPGDALKFVSAIGLGSAKRDASVVFHVFVDGEERYRSPLYRIGEAVLPVVVDVAGVSELKLAVSDGGDGITNDYAWWGEARFIGK